MIRKTMRRGTEKPSPSILFSMDLGVWGLFHVSAPPQNFKMPRLRKSGAYKRIHRQCLHCCAWFHTNREEQQFCKDGCRTYNNRLKRAAIVRWLIERGASSSAADDVMDIKGLSVMGRQMETMGLFWNGHEWSKK